MEESEFRPIPKKTHSQYLVNIAERALADEFENMLYVRHGNPGYAFRCLNGKKIEVKATSSTCLNLKCEFVSWMFNIKLDARADYYFLLAFSDRTNLIPKHLWFVPVEVVYGQAILRIDSTEHDLDLWAQYERPLDNVKRNLSRYNL